MAKYITCVKPAGSVVLFDGLVAMERGNILQVSDDAFNRSDIQGAISAGFLIQGNQPVTPSGQGLFQDVGNWDASIQTNYPAETHGHSYFITAPGNLTNGSQTESYLAGDRILFNSNGIWEKLGGVSGSGSGFTGGVFLTEALNVDQNAGIEVTTTPNGLVTDVRTNDASVAISVTATANAQGGIPTMNVTYPGGTAPVTLVIGPAGIQGEVVISPNASGEIKFTHENGAEATIDFTLVVIPFVSLATIVDSANILVAPRTEYAPGDTFRVDMTFSSSPEVFQVEASGPTTGSTITSVTPGLTQAQKTVTVKDGSGNSAVRVRAGMAIGGVVCWSIWTLSSNKALFNNTMPNMTVGTVTNANGYPAADFNEVVTIAGSTFTNTDVITVTSPVSHFTNIPAPGPASTYGSFTVKCSVGDVYSLTTDNLRFTIRKNSNGRTRVVDVALKIASKSLSVVIDTGGKSLRSSLIGHSNVISMRDSTGLQKLLLSGVTLGREAGSGEWETPGWTISSDEKTVSRGFIVSDSNTKGVYGWQSMVVRNLAGKVAARSGGNSYLLAGFTLRDFKVEAQIPPTSDGRTAFFGVNAYDTALLRCTNSSFGSDANNYTYEGTVDDVAVEVGEFTLLNTAGGTPGANVVGKDVMLHGAYWYNKNEFNANTNTVPIANNGGMDISIQELASNYTAVEV